MLSTKPRKFIASCLLVPIVLAVLGFTWSFGSEMNDTISRSKRNAKKIDEVDKEYDKKIYDIHWLLIKKNNVIVPPRKTNKE